MLSIHANYYGVACTLRVLEGVQRLQCAQVQVQEVERLRGVHKEEAWGTRCEQGKGEQGAEGEWEGGKSSIGNSFKDEEARLSSY